MDRMPRHSFVPAIERAYTLIPKELHKYMSPDFLCGVDPVFAGLHAFKDTNDGRSYRDTAHCAYPHHQPGLVVSQRRTTIVLPLEVRPSVVVHELGHVLHEALKFEPVAVALNGYARTNHHEAFAEAFTSWVVPGYWSTGGKQDRHINGLLEHLAAA